MWKQQVARMFRRTKHLVTDKARLKKCFQTNSKLRRRAGYKAYMKNIFFDVYFNSLLRIITFRSNVKHELIYITIIIIFSVLRFKWPAVHYIRKYPIVNVQLSEKGQSVSQSNKRETFSFSRNNWECFKSLCHLTLHICQLFLLKTGLKKAAILEASIGLSSWQRQRAFHGISVCAHSLRSVWMTSSKVMVSERYYLVTVCGRAPLGSQFFTSS